MNPESSTPNADFSQPHRAGPTNPIDWRPIDRALFLQFLVMLVTVANTFFIFSIGTGDLEPYVNPVYYRVTLGVAVLLMVLTGVLFGTGIAARKRTDDLPILSDLLTQGFTLGVIFFSYSVGLYTTSIAALLVDGIALGLPLLHPGAILRSLITGVIVTTLVVIGLETGFLPYAPIFHTYPANSEGSPLGVIRYWQITLLIVSPVTVWFVVNLLTERWRERENQLRELSIIDTLTGLFNRRRFFELLASECLRTRRTERPVTLVMGDLDHFKEINDTYGHAAGDAVLREVANCIRSEIRVGIDAAGRFGGEELVILLPETPLEAAAEVTERIRDRIRNTPVYWSGSEIAVTASFGIASASGLAADSDTLLELADSRLYRAKQSGRNRVIFA